MEDKILFISDRESFIIKSIMKKIKEEGGDCVFSTLDSENIKGLRSEIESSIYFYIDDLAAFDEGELIFLNDFCLTNGFQLNVIAYETDAKTLKDGIFAGSNIETFPRPVNAKGLALEIVSKMNSAPVNLNKKHILVVDDSGMMLNTIREWLSDKYRVSMVNSAMNAISFLANIKPDLILLDYEMPACTGAEFLEMLRMDGGEEIPVIFLTGHNDPETVKKVIALKPVGYLLKSLPKEKIVGMIDTFFEGKRSDE